MYFTICLLRYSHYYYRHSDSIVINPSNNTDLKAGTDSDYDVVPGSFDHCKRYYILCYYISRYRILLHFASKVITFCVNKFITFCVTIPFCVKSYHILRYY